MLPEIVTNTDVESVVPGMKPRGAPRLNTNARKHGARGTLTLSKVTPGTHLVGRFRGELERLVTERDGKVSLRHEALILSACRAELCVKLQEAWARKDGRTDEERLQTAMHACALSERRDRIIDRLGLVKKPDAADDWAAALAAADAAEATPVLEEASR